MPILPLRLDRVAITGDARRLGEVFQLPDAPALCLEAVAGDRSALLVVDQLDAIRWNAAHSTEALDACRETLRQAKASKRLKIVVACRTFDLEHEPTIKRWRGEESAARDLRVGPLPEADVRAVVERAGVDFAALTSRERNLLTNVQNLAAWVEVVASTGKPGFSTATELNRRFWTAKSSEAVMRGVSDGEFREALDAVVEVMERTSRLDAHLSTLQRHPRAADVLESLNVQQRHDGRLAFSHQTHRDFWVADRALVEMAKGRTTVRQWLGDRPRQSLFRRETLRVLLLRRRDDDPSCYVADVRAILFDPDVRFHLKQVALQTFGTIGDPKPPELAFVAALLQSPDWRDHAANEFLLDDNDWFSALDDDGVWRTMLGSDDEAAIHLAIHLMHFAAPKAGASVAALLQPYEDAGEPWSTRIDRVLPFDPTTDPEPLFELRLRRARRGGGGEPHPLIEAERLPPERFIRLTAARWEAAL
ncbi:MAG: hypothetical protein ACRDD1_08465, partial [Planctomycetia bacterium]